MAESGPDPDVIELTVDIVSSYVSNNSMPAAELPNLVNSIYSSLKKISGEPEETVKQPPTPAVPVRRSVADDHIVCLEDGKSFKSLKRHLQTVHGMSPDQYRERWGLGRDYPMVAPAYAKARSALAKGMGLGASRRRAEADLDDAVPEANAPAVEENAAPAPKKRGRKPKTATE